MLLREFLIVCFLFLSVSGDEECESVSPYRKCLHHVPREKMEGIHVVPDREELLEICPGQLSYFECFTEHLDDCGKMNEHYTVTEFMESTYEIAKELCDENSDLFRDYVANAECYKTLEGAGDACMEEARDIYEAYFQYIKREHPERLEAVHKSSQQNCMIQSYKAACLSETVLRTCGETARRTFMDIVSRTQYLRQFCSQSMIDELKTDFIDRMGEHKDDENIDIYRSAFGVMRK